MDRREFLREIGALGGLAIAGNLGSIPAAAESSATASVATDHGSHHPGPPRFVAVNDPLEDFDGGEEELRDGLAPRNPDPDAEYSWSVAEAPGGSTATVGDDPVASFDPDVPGEYVLELDAPDGSERTSGSRSSSERSSDGGYEQTIRVYPEENANERLWAEERDEPVNVRPRVRIDGTVEGDEVRLDVAPKPAASIEGVTQGAADDPSDLDVELFVDDRDPDVLDRDRQVVDVSGLDEPVRVYAVAVGHRHSVADALRVDPTGDSVSVERPYAPPEWAKDAVVYEIFTRRFPDQDDPTFRTMIDRLDHLEQLGVDALWMTPFLPTDRGFGTDADLGGPHGYHITDYFDVDPDLGTMADFEAFVDACHERDIKVIFDLVINHTSSEHPHFQAAIDPDHPDHERYRDWYRWEEEYEKPETYYGWWDEETDSGIPNLNYENPAVREWALEVVDFWAEKVDGIRADVAWGVQQSFWKEVYEHVHAEHETYDGGKFLLLDETLPPAADMSEGQFDMHYDQLLAISLNVAVQESTEPFRNVHRFHDAVGFPDDDLWLQYVENHDYEEARYHTAHDLETQRVAAAATFTLPGTPMIYYGQETGLDGPRAPMNWGEFDDEHLAFYEDLVDARKSQPALSFEADLAWPEYDSPSDHVVAFAREHDDQRVVVALNFDRDPQPVTVDVDGNLDGTDLVRGEEIDVENADDGAEFDVDTAAVLEVGGDVETDDDLLSGFGVGAAAAGAAGGALAADRLHDGTGDGDD